MDKAYSLANRPASITHLAVIKEFPFWLLWGLRASSPAQWPPSPTPAPACEMQPWLCARMWGKCHCSLMTVASLHVYLMIHRELKTRKFCYLYSSFYVQWHYTTATFLSNHFRERTVLTEDTILQTSPLPFTVLQAPQWNKTLFLTGGIETEKHYENTLHVPSAF